MGGGGGEGIGDLILEALQLDSTAPYDKGLTLVGHRW